MNLLIDPIMAQSIVFSLSRHAAAVAAEGGAS